MNRRIFLQAVAGGASVFSVCRRGFAAADPAIAATQLTEKLTLISGAGGNVVVLNEPDGLLLVNGASPERTADLVSFIDDHFKGRHVAAIFNTCWHLEHTGSNEAFRKSGAKIFAHENTKLWIGADFYSDWEQKRYKPRPAAARPTDTFYSDGKTTFGSEPIEYGYMMQAHTDGDIYVFFPNQNVLAAGDVVSVGRYPILDYVTGGWIGGLQNAAQALLKVGNAQTQIVPGVGPVQTREDLKAEADMANTMRERLVNLMRQGMGPSDMIAAAPGKEYDAKWGAADLFIRQAYRGMWGHVRELGRIV